MFFTISHFTGLHRRENNYTAIGMALLTTLEIGFIALSVLAFIKNPYISSLGLTAKIGFLSAAFFFLIFDGCNIYVRRAFSPVLGTLFLEPGASFKAAFLYWKGLKSNFNYYGLNDTKAQNLTRNPILLIHGSNHNQSAWIPLAQVLQKEGFTAFTLNLPDSWEVTEKNKQIVTKKIEEIYKQTGSSVDLIGHSLGGAIIDTCSGYGVNRVIKIGMTGADPKSDRLYEIWGRRDVLVKEPSMLPSTQQKGVDCGHLSLLYHLDVHAEIIRILKS